jgi:serine protease Do
MNLTQRSVWQIMSLLILAVMLRGGAANRAVAADWTDERSQISQQVSRLRPEDIEVLASRTTVVIAQGLQTGEVEAGTAFNSGSGVIVAKSGKTYYVATNLHVVQRDTTYGIRTYDGEIHAVTQYDEAFGIQRLGIEINDDQIQGFDLAIITFKSNQDYPLVGINLLQPVAKGDETFVSGWPQSLQNQPMYRQFSPGNVVDIQPPSQDGGYGLLYSSATAIGMSGGPVFNEQGQVIGIHGRGEGGNVNQGIQIEHFIRETEAARRVNSFLNSLEVQRSVPTPETLAQWASDRPAAANQFDNPETAFREAFRLAGIRDCSGSRVDTGDPEDDCRNQ